MRVISGKYRGRIIKGFDISGTRPTMDRIKESMMAMIQSHIKNSTCLDLFAGSGSLGIELLSNGAKKCYFVDSNIIAIKTIQTNIKDLKIEEANEIIFKDHLTALKNFKDQMIKFDIIILDPPYHLKLINNILTIINDYQLLNNQGIVICEYEGEIINNNSMNLLKEKHYGHKHIKIYQKTK